MTLFNSPELTITDDQIPADGTFFDALVGDGKKFKDPEALARGKYMSDRHVKQVEAEAKAARDRILELEEELNTRTNMQAFLDEMKDIQHREAPNPVADLSQRNEGTPSLKPEDIDKLLDSKLEEQRRKDIITRNINYVQAEVQKALGDGWQNQLKARATQLGLSEDFLASVAAQSPQGFLEIMLPKTQQRKSDPNADLPPRSHVSSSVDTSGSSVVRNKAYWDKMKKSNPKEWENQTAQRHRDAQRQGESFFQ